MTRMLNAIKFQVILILIIVFAATASASQNQPEKIVLKGDTPLIQDFKKAVSAYWNADYLQSVEMFENIIYSYPRFALGYIYLADALKMAGKENDAYKYYQKAYLLLEEKKNLRGSKVPEAKEPELYADMCYCLNAMKRYDDVKTVGLLGTVSGFSPDLLTNLAYAYFKSGNAQLALSNYCEAKKSRDSKEFENLTSKRITRVFENGKEWSPTCPDEKNKNIKGENYALIIAVGKYLDAGINSLKYAENDARALYKILTDPLTGIFKNQNVTILVNEEATEKNIKFKFDDIIMQAQNPEDMLLVFYAGHGFTYPDGTDTYWLTYDTILGDKNGSRIRSTAFSNLALATKISDIKANQMVFFIDACYSSGMTDTPTSIRRLDSYMATNKNYIIVTSSQADQRSIESPKLKHGIFSHFLVEGLGGKADSNADGWIDIEELWPFIKDSVAGHARLMGENQIPVRSGSSSGKMILSRNPNF